MRIKICGITTPADAEQAAALGVDMIGLNFYAKSPRCINEATARAIVQALPASVVPVALFVNEPPDASCLDRRGRSKSARCRCTASCRNP